MASGRPVTRFITRSTGQALQGPLPHVQRPRGAQRPAGIRRAQRPKPYHCIICDRQFASKNWVTRHHHSHNVPYIDHAEDLEAGEPAYREYMPAHTHPSCWTAEDNSIDRIRELTALKIDAHRVLRGSAGTAEQDANHAALAMEQVGALNEEELLIKQENRRLRMWLWWWTTQLGEVQELAEPAHGAGISVLGDAGGLNLVEQGLATAYNPVVVGDADRYEERQTSGTISNNTGFHELDINPTNRLEGTRSTPELGPGRGAFDLATNYRNGRITKEAVYHYLSDVTIGFVSRSGENFDSGTTIANAALAFVEVISQSQIRVQDCRNRVALRHLRAAVPGSIDARYQETGQFRTHRINFFVIMKQATEEFFRHHPNGIQDDLLLRRLRSYARSLGDERASAEANSCLNGNDVLLGQLIAEKEDWRQEI